MALEYTKARKTRPAYQDSEAPGRAPGLRWQRSPFYVSQRSPSFSNLTLAIIVLWAAVLLAPSFLTSCTGDKHLTTEQKLEDLCHLFQVFKDNHPYLASKDSVEVYDWLSHELDFKEIIAGTKDDEEFAQAIEHILLLLNNSHTFIMNPKWHNILSHLPREFKPWRDEVDKTDPRAVADWLDMATKSARHPDGYTLSFRACYNQGEYLVYWMSDSFRSALGMDPGCTVDSVNGVDVHEFVAGLHGKVRQTYDPHLKRFYVPEFDVPYSSMPYKIGFRDSSGNLVKKEADFCPVTTSIHQPSWPFPKPEAVPYHAITLAEGRIAYVHLAKMDWHGWGEEILLPFYQRTQDSTALIIDIRNNSGGDDFFWIRNIVRPLASEPLTGVVGTISRTRKYLEPFLEAHQTYDLATIEKLAGEDKGQTLERTALALTKEQLEALPPELLEAGFQDPAFSQITIYPSKEAPFGGKIFVLTGPKTSGAAEKFAAFCKTSGWATVIGECTDGGSGMGIPAVVTLPNSNICVLFPQAISIGDTYTHIAPHIFVEQAPEDIVKYAEVLATDIVPVQPNPDYDTVLRKCLDIALQKSP